MLNKEELCDVIYDCYINIYGIELSDNLIKEILNELPIGIKFLAKEWGAWDTEVREKIYDYLKGKKEE